MSQVNSQIATKACTYDFNVEGDALGGKYLGLSFNPGETIIDVKVKILTAFTGAIDATDFYLQYQSPTIGLGTYFYLKNKINTGGNPINNGLGLFEKASEVSYRIGDIYNLPFPIGYLGDLNVYFTSTNSITGGALLAEFTYIKHDL